MLDPSEITAICMAAGVFSFIAGFAAGGRIGQDAKRRKTRKPLQPVELPSGAAPEPPTRREPAGPTFEPRAAAAIYLGAGKEGEAPGPGMPRRSRRPRRGGK